MGTLKPPFKFLASIRIAILIILGLAIISAVGTITEARYDAEVAQKLVYHSIYMYIILGTLIVTLIAVMIDRWPWQQHHAGFVTAHVGIIILLFGSWLTQKYGVDGTLDVEIGQTRDSVMVRERDLTIYSSLTGDKFTTLYSSEVDFLRNPPSESKPFIINLGSDELKILQYEHFAFRESEIDSTTNEQDGPAIRFQLENPNVNLTQWLRRENQRPSNEIDLGPAKVIFANAEPKPMGRNAVVLITKPKSETLDYIIFNKDNTVRKKGKVKQSETIETGWMGMKFRLLRYLPHSKETVKYKVSPTASPASTSALRFTFRGQEHWLGLDSGMRVYLEDKMYFFRYGRRMLKLTFPVTLKKFTMGTYEGTDHASSYESLVDVKGRGEVLISMNEPMHEQGYTFYQSSFVRDESGEPTTSVFSVNYDPGRWVKYVGSMLIVFGSILLFWFKRTIWFSRKKESRP